MTIPSAEPTLARTLAALFYEILLGCAVLLAFAAVLTPLKALLPAGLLADWLFRLTLAALMFGYCGFCWTRGGQTLAMKTWRLRVERADGAALSWLDSLRRFLVVLALFVGVPVLVWAGWSRALGEAAPLWLLPLWLAVPFACRLFDPAKLSLHDRLAATRVVQLPKRV
ncbi:RDD family protein [Crenobacter caeni]|uniref:RDD family protein n=1 Tax=Crenobacter caeni TaxID=2705474 RepID=A0A6B2KTM4_9NEIS|nr:RDD family protein [Crenobacter caeni]NDV13596.1 RDD family protein [Crenobacter caeni]